MSTVDSGGSTDELCRTPLMAAVERGDEDEAFRLTSAGADINTRDNKGVPVIIKAAEGGSVKMITILAIGQDTPVELDARDTTGRNAVMAAAQHGNFKALVALKGRGASLAEVDVNGNTALHYAAGRTNGELALEYLAQETDLLKAQNTDGQTPLMTAVRSKNPENVRELVRLGADVSIRDNNGRSAADAASEETRGKFRDQMLRLLGAEPPLAVTMAEPAVTTVKPKAAAGLPKIKL